MCRVANFLYLRSMLTRTTRTTVPLGCVMWMNECKSDEIGTLGPEWGWSGLKLRQGKECHKHSGNEPKARCRKSRQTKTVGQCDCGLLYPGQEPVSCSQRAPSAGAPRQCPRKGTNTIIVWHCGSLILDMSLGCWFALTFGPDPWSDEPDSLS